jgi:hypothetical protein
MIGKISHGITNKSHNLKQIQAVDRWNKLEMEQFHTPGSLKIFYHGVINQSQTLWRKFLILSPLLKTARDNLLSRECKRGK